MGPGSTPVTGKLWTPSEWDMIYSQHFNPECFREIKFSGPDNFQNPDNSLQRSAKNSKCAGIFLENPPLEADPSEVYITPVTITTVHHYHITGSPKTLKRKLDEFLAENHKLRRKLRNASYQEERLNKNVENLLDKLHSKDILLREVT